MIFPSGVSVSLPSSSSSLIASYSGENWQGHAEEQRLDDEEDEEEEEEEEEEGLEDAKEFGEEGIA